MGDDDVRLRVHKTLANRLALAMRQPRQAWHYAAARLRGALITLRYRGPGDRVRIGRQLKLVRKMRISGPGRCTIGNTVSIDGTMHTVDLPTYTVDAEIVIGDGSFINGARFGCAKRIVIGKNCILGDCRIMDTNFHSLYPGRRDDPALVKVGAVQIGDDCWIGAAAIILPGTRIRRGSTVAAGSVVMGRFPPNSVIAGNPAQVIMSIADSPATEQG